MQTTWVFAVVAGEGKMENADVRKSHGIEGRYRSPVDIWVGLILVTTGDDAGRTTGAAIKVEGEKRAIHPVRPFFEGRTSTRLS